MLEYHNVSISYGNNQNKKVVNDFSASFQKGKITTIIGPNGSGKTTLFQALNKSANLSNGSITVDGEDIFKIDPRQRARKIAYLPQIREHIPSMSVKALVEHGRFPHMGFYRRAGAEDKEKVYEAMKVTQTLDYSDSRVDTLSGGIRQRVYLAMVLAQDSDIIVLDEPTTYLDIKAQNDFLDIVERLRELGKTVIIVLHDLHQAFSVSDELIVLKNGEMTFKGSPIECIDKGIMESVFGVKVYSINTEDGVKYFFE